MTFSRGCDKSFLLFELFYDYLLEHGVADDRIVRIALDDVKNEALLDPRNLSDYISDHTQDPSVHYRRRGNVAEETGQERAREGRQE